MTCGIEEVAFQAVAERYFCPSHTFSRDLGASRGIRRWPAKETREPSLDRRNFERRVTKLHIRRAGWLLAKSPFDLLVEFLS